MSLTLSEVLLDQGEARALIKALKQTKINVCEKDRERSVQQMEQFAFLQKTKVDRQQRAFPFPVQEH